METILKVIKQESHDRNVFATYSNGEIVGLNFHQDCATISWDFKTPCPALTDIYERLNDKNHIASEEERINKAIELYTNAFIFQDENTYNIPLAQLALIQKALDVYIELSEKFNDIQTDNVAYELFDMKQLRAMMYYQINITISDTGKDKFAKRHGMDFPQYL